MAKCRICSCTEGRACVGACSWVESDLCSTCDEAIEAIVQHAEVAYKFRPQKLIKAAQARYREEALAG